jgi:hypothetical protein
MENDGAPLKVRYFLDHLLRLWQQLLTAMPTRAHLQLASLHLPCDSAAAAALRAAV